MLSWAALLWVSFPVIASVQLDTRQIIGYSVFGIFAILGFYAAYKQWSLLKSKNKKRQDGGKRPKSGVEFTNDDC